MFDIQFNQKHFLRDGLELITFSFPLLYKQVFQTELTEYSRCRLINVIWYLNEQLAPC